MLARLRPRQHFDRDAVVRIDAHFVAGFQRRFGEPSGALKDGRLHPVLAADAEAICAQHFGDFRDRAGRFETEIAHDDVGLVHEHPRAVFQLIEIDPRIDVAVVIRAADHDLRRLRRGTAEIGADAIGRRGDLLDDLLQLLDHLPRVADRLLLISNALAQGKQVAPQRIARSHERDEAIKRLEHAQLFPARDRAEFFEIVWLVGHFEPAILRAPHRSIILPSPVRKRSTSVREKEVEAIPGATYRAPPFSPKES